MQRSQNPSLSALAAPKIRHIQQKRYLFTSGVRGFAAKDFIWRAFIFYAWMRVKIERTPKYYFPGRALLNSYQKSLILTALGQWA
jgi:hypothetical protein